MAFEIEMGVLKKYTPEPNETEVLIPSGVTKIGERAFDNCSYLIRVIIPDGVSHIGNEAFQDCISLRQILLPNSLRIIGKQAFMRCKSLTQIAIPNNVIDLDMYTFFECKQLSHVSLPDKLLSIKGRVFASCYNLGEIKLSDGIKEIGWEAFRDCYSLKKMQLPASIKIIGPDAFKGTARYAMETGEKLLAIIPEELKPLLKGTGLLGNKAIQLKFVTNEQKSKPAKKQTHDIEQCDGSESIKAWLENQPSISLIRNKYPEVVLPKIKLKSNKPAPVEALQFIAYSYFKSITDLPGQNKTNYRTAIGKASFVPDADKLAELLDRDSLCEALSELAFEETYFRDYQYEQKYKVPVKKKPKGKDKGFSFTDWLYETSVKHSIEMATDPYWEITVQALCRYGDEAMIDRVCKWINHFLDYQNFELRGRKYAILGRTALLLSDTGRAAMYLDKCGALKAYAQMRNKTEAEIRDGFASALGFDADGTLSLDDEARHC